MDSAIPITEVAKRLGNSKRSVYRLIAEGILPKPIKERGCSRLFTSDVDAYLKRLKESR